MRMQQSAAKSTVRQVERGCVSCRPSVDNLLVAARFLPGPPVRQGSAFGGGSYQSVSKIYADRIANGGPPSTAVTRHDTAERLGSNQQRSPFWRSATRIQESTIVALDGAA